MGGQPGGHAAGVGALPLHAQRKGLNAAHGQIAFKGTEHGANGAAKSAQRLGVRGVGDDGAAEDVAVAGQVLGDAVDAEMGAQFQRADEERRGEGVVDQKRRPGFVGNGGDGIDFADAPKQQFNAAVDAYRAGQYAQAEEQFKAFLAANATHRLAPDAIFYLGETYFQRSRPREAAEQYLKLSTDFGKSSRAPEGMLRLGQSLAMLGSNDQACATFAEVGKRYPTAAPPIKKSAEREMQKDHC